MHQYAAKLFETAESGVDKVVSSCEKNPSVHKRYMNFLRQRKTALDAPLYAVSSGRSKIEMLGVLAIIGVLSVGGIAGYSKAMEKFKINKATEEYSYLIHGLLSNLDEARKQKSSDSLVSLVEYVKAAGIVPETWNKEEIDNRRMSDPYGNIVQFFVRDNKVVMDMFIGSNNTEDGDISSKGFSPKFCNAIMQNVGQPLAPVLYRIWFIMSGKNAGIYYGNDYCSACTNCIRAMSLEKINDICNQCNNKNSCGIIWEF